MYIYICIYICSRFYQNSAGLLTRHWINYVKQVKFPMAFMLI